MMKLPSIEEAHVTLIAEGCELKGSVKLSELSRVHGIIRGDLSAPKGSTVILGETAVVEGNIQADTLVVEGFVQGDIKAGTKVVISRSGRVIGNIQTQKLVVETGAHLDGKTAATLSPAASPA
ncbi:MAG: polymer-forming cytoskeletal protein [Bdellovibrionales bacterium]|nr:polymer-forming cytoskeletal protein [Bdellovibrionales bacterium]